MANDVLLEEDAEESVDLDNGGFYAEVNLK